MKVRAETEDDKEGGVHRFGHRRKTLELIDPYFSVLHFSVPVLPTEKCRTEKCGVAEGFDEIERCLDPGSRLIEIAQIMLDARDVRERGGFTAGLADVARESERFLQTLRREPRGALFTIDPSHSDKSAGLPPVFADRAPERERPMEVFERLLFATQRG